jgi:hypothetical protein
MQFGVDTSSYCSLFVGGHALRTRYLCPCRSDCA